MDFYCTTAGYIGAGAPIRATLFVPDKTQPKKFEKILATVELKRAGKITHVKFKTSVKFPYSKIGFKINIIGTEERENIENGGWHSLTDHNCETSSSEMRIKKSNIIGNTITTIEDSDIGGSHSREVLSVSFDNIKNPKFVTQFSFEYEYENNYKHRSYYFFKGKNIPLNSRSEDPKNTKSFRVKGDVSNNLSEVLANGANLLYGKPQKYRFTYFNKKSDAYIGIYLY